MSYYDLTYKKVNCYAVEWEADPHLFFFKMKGKVYQYMQKDEYSCCADTDYIRHEIDMFLNEQLYEYIKALNEILDCKEQK